MTLLSSFSSRRTSLGIMAWRPFSRGHFRHQQSNYRHQDPSKMRSKNKWSHQHQSPRPNLCGTRSTSMPRSRTSSRSLSQPLPPMCWLVKLRALAGRVAKRNPKSSPQRHPNHKHFLPKSTRSRLTRLCQRDRRPPLLSSRRQGKSLWSTSLAKMR